MLSVMTASRFFLPLLATSLWIVAGTVQGSTGVGSQLALPPGASVEVTATTPTWTIVANNAANFITPRGEVVPGAGELLVYNNATGKLTRRLRSPLPFPYAYMGGVMAASGDIVVVTDGERSVRAFNCATGLSLWRVDFNPYAVGGLAIDADRVLVGMVDSDFVRSNVLSVKTGAILSSSGWSSNMDYCNGSSLAICGQWLAIGSPRTKVNGLIGAGVVFIQNPFGTVTAISFPTQDEGFQFGNSVAISGTSLYVGSVRGNQVYHYDLRTLTYLGAINPPSAIYLGFGNDLRIDGHLLLIRSSDGLWLYDRQTGLLSTILWADAGAIGAKVAQGGSLGGRQVTAPAGGRLFRAVGVAGGRFGGSIAAVTQTNAGGVTGARYLSLADSTMNAAGGVLFAARMGGSGVSSSSDTGLWTGVSGMNQLRLREGSLSDSTKAGTAFRPFFSVDNSKFFSFNRSSTGAVSLWGGTDASVPLILPGASEFFSGETSQLKIGKVNTASAVLASSVLANLGLSRGPKVNAGNDSVIAREGLIFSVEAREGSSSGLVNAPHAQLNPRLATFGNRLAFSSFLSGRPSISNAAVFVKVIGGSQVPAIQKGEVPPGTFGQFPDAVLSNLTGEALSPALTVIRGTYKTAKFSAAGVWAYNNNTGDKYSVAWERGQVPGFPVGTVWRRILKVFSTADGTLLFLAQIRGPGITSNNDVGFWRCGLGSNAPTVLVREGQVLPGSHEAVLGTIQQVDAGSDGSWALLASLSRCSAAQNQILIGGKVTVDSGFNIVTRKGLGIDGAATGAIQLSLALPGNTTDAAGMSNLGQGRAVESSRVLYRAGFKHGSELATTGIWGY